MRLNFFKHKSNAYKYRVSIRDQSIYYLIPRYTLFTFFNKISIIIALQTKFVVYRSHQVVGWWLIGVFVFYSYWLVAMKFGTYDLHQVYMSWHISPCSFETLNVCYPCVCMCEFNHLQTDWLTGWMDACMCEWVHEWVCVCMHVCVGGVMSVNA